jgi:hypothetical protein
MTMGASDLPLLREMSVFLTAARREAIPRRLLRS